MKKHTMHLPNDEQDVSESVEPIQLFPPVILKPFDKDFNIHFLAVTQHYKLKRSGVEVSFDILLNFLTTEKQLTRVEIKHLKRLYDTDPGAPNDLLQRVISKEIKRVDMICP